MHDWKWWSWVVFPHITWRLSFFLIANNPLVSSLCRNLATALKCHVKLSATGHSLQFAPDYFRARSDANLFSSFLSIAHMASAVWTMFSNVHKESANPKFACQSIMCKHCHFYFPKAFTYLKARHTKNIWHTSSCFVSTNGTYINTTSPHMNAEQTLFE